MKNSEIFTKLGELSLKYANKGLTIEFEFDRFGMVLRGWLDMTLNHVDVFKCARRYDYVMLQSLSDEIDIEKLVDDFKEEVFEKYMEEKERTPKTPKPSPQNFQLLR